MPSRARRWANLSPTPLRDRDINGFGCGHGSAPRRGRNARALSESSSVTERHWAAARASTSMALGRGKVTRHASATVPRGDGGLKGAHGQDILPVVDRRGRRQGQHRHPRPEATMCRMVSRELPSVTMPPDSVRRVLMVSTSSGTDSSTWSRKQCPGPSSNSGWSAS